MIGASFALFTVLLGIQGIMLIVLIIIVPIMLSLIVMRKESLVRKIKMGSLFFIFEALIGGIVSLLYSLLDRCIGDYINDIEEKAEKNFEDHVTCDLLKIAHHGSKTSTTIEFLEKVNYQTAIIMNGYYNIFGFPSKTVINRIKKKPYYVTGLEKTIIYRKLFFKEKFVKRKNLI
jgi:hypothetical protein